MNKQDLIKSISRKQNPSSPGKTDDWKDKKDQQEEETSMLEDVRRSGRELLVNHAA